MKDQNPMDEQRQVWEDPLTRMRAADVLDDKGLKLKRSAMALGIREGEEYGASVLMVRTPLHLTRPLQCTLMVRTPPRLWTRTRCSWRR